MARWVKFNLFGIIWAAVIGLLCLTPASQMPKFDLGYPFYSDKFLHLFFYAVLTLLLIQGLGKQTEFIKLRLFNYRYAIIIAISYGIIIELLQLLIPGRSFDLLDILANGIGTLVGMFFFYILFRY